MARFGLCGSSYTSQSFNSDCQQLFNMYLEQNDANSKSPFSLYPCGGLKVFATGLGDSPNRGSLFINGRLFKAIGSKLFEIFADGTFTDRGNIAKDGGIASFASTATQFMVVSAGKAYSYILATNAFLPIAGMLGTPSICANLNGYFIALLADSNQFQWSTPGDVTAWDALDTAEIEVFPDNCVSMIVDHGELWFFGLTKSIPYALTGTFGLVFEPIETAFIEQGIVAKNAVVRMDNSLFWWGTDDRGSMIAWRANGYLPSRVSNHAVEYAVQGYGTVNDAISFSYQDQGHTFWQTYFPSANGGLGVTWVYDAATGQWFQRGFLNNGVQEAHRAVDHVFAFGKHLVGDRASGDVYQMSIPVANGSVWDFADDFGNPIRRSRRCPVLSIENQWAFYSELEIDLEVGLGPIPPLTTDGAAPAVDRSNWRAPQLMLRWSNDSGQTWSNERTLDCGQAGEYSARVIARMLGKARKGRVFEIAMSDPIPWRITDGYLKGTGFQTTQRLSEKLRQSA
jgi:hypothetical protein